MSFANALNILRPTLPYYLALTKYGLLRITKDRFEFHPHPAAPPVALEMLGGTGHPSVKRSTRMELAKQTVEIVERGS